MYKRQVLLTLVCVFYLSFSLLVPNVKGGASVPLAANEKAMEKANPMYNSIYSQIGQYWGDVYKRQAYEQSAFYLSRMMLELSLDRYVMENALGLARAEIEDVYKRQQL